MQERKNKKASIKPANALKLPRQRSRSTLLSRAAIEAIESRIMLSAYALSAVASFPANGGGPASPNSTIVQDSSGDIIGADDAFGAKSAGEIFEVQQGNTTVTTVASFDHTVSGDKPEGAVTLDENGNLFGTTSDGGPTGDNSLGTVFELASGTTTITTLAYLDGTNDGSPDSNLVMDANGNLFGTASNTIFEVAAGSTPGGLATTVANFNTSATSMNPAGGIVIDSSGDISGTDQDGGTTSDGSVWEYQSGSNGITTLDSFDSTTTGSLPTGLTQDADGDLFGSTNEGGSAGDGAVWEMQQGTTSITAITSFDGTAGINPVGGVIVDDTGDIYGVTQTDATASTGTVFEIGQGSSTITTLATFPSSGVDGINPDDLIFGQGGVLYGTTNNGGANSQGAIFELSSTADTTTAVTSNHNPSTSGQSVTLTATVTSAGGSGETGTIQFMDGNADLGSPVAVNSTTGVATYTTSALSGGGHLITAVYSGDGNFNPNTSPIFTQTVSTGTLIGTTTAVTSNHIPATSGQSVTLTATVKPASGSGETGTVQFKDGGTNLGAPVTVNSSTGVATYTTSALSSGGHSITAVYSGDSAFATSTSSIFTQTVNSGTLTGTTTALSSSNSPNYGQAVKFTATVTPTSGTGETGTVQFMDGNTALGSPVTLSNTTGTASYSTSALNAGKHLISAVYSGDGNFATSTSPTLTEWVGTAVLTVTANTNYKVYGTTASDSGTVGGVTNGDKITAAFSSTGDISTAGVNSYPITEVLSDGGTGTLANYTVKYIGATLTVTQAMPTIKVTDAGGTDNGSAYPATATVTGVSGTAAASLEGVTPTLTYYAGASVNGTALSGAPVNAGQYTALATFAGSTDYAAASGSITFNIVGTATTIHAADLGGVYTGKTYPATGYVANSAGTSIGTPAFAYYNSTDTARAHPLSGAPSAVGSYFFVATYAGNGTYAASTTSAPFSITKAATIVHITDAGGAYSGKTFAATATATNSAGASVGTPTIAYYAASDTSHAHPLNAPSAPGSYVAVATFAGNTDYNASSASVSFKITIPVTSFTASKIVFKAAVSFKGVVAQFDASSALPATDFTATITWGDGTSSAATVVESSTKGIFQITGTHTWAKTSTYTTIITLTPVATTALTAKGSAT